MAKTKHEKWYWRITVGRSLICIGQLIVAVIVVLIPLIVDDFSWWISGFCATLILILAYNEFKAIGRTDL